MTPARRVAWRVLCDVEAGGFASDALLELLNPLDSRDAGLATELVFGVLRRRAQLDYLLNLAASRPVAELDIPVRVAARMGAYQLRFLDRIPPHAAVGECVELVKQSQKRSAAGFVNAVLRRLPVVPEQWPDEPTRWSLPAWILERWQRVYGPETAAAIAGASLVTPETWVRIPPDQPVPLGLEPTAVSGCFHAPSGAPPGCRIQDISSQAIVPLLDLQPGQKFLDLCAAPGNKTAQALETPQLLAIACDASPARLRKLLAKSPRVRLDASLPLPFPPVFDRILVDAPCSGTGTLARNPEIKWRLTRDEIRRQAIRQKQVLRSALDCLKPGGRLVYATCSLEPEENAEVVNEVAPSRVILNIARLPGRDPGDGFHAAVLT